MKRLIIFLCLLSSFSAFAQYELRDNMSKKTSTIDTMRLVTKQVASSGIDTLFGFRSSDSVMVKIHKNDLGISGGGGSGTVNSGTANTIAYYGSTGTAVSSLAAMGTSMAMVTDGSGLPTSHGSTTAAQIGHLSTATGSIRKTGTTASSSTPAPTGDGMQNTYTITALATNPTFAAPSGTAVDQNILLIRITDNGTTRTLSWNSIYDEGADLSLPTATIAGETMYVQFVYNSAVSKWQLIGRTGGF